MKQSPAQVSESGVGSEGEESTYMREVGLSPNTGAKGLEIWWWRVAEVLRVHTESAGAKVSVAMAAMRVQEACASKLVRAMVAKLAKLAKGGKGFSKPSPPWFP